METGQDIVALEEMRERTKDMIIFRFIRAMQSLVGLAEPKGTSLNRFFNGRSDGAVCSCVLYHLNKKASIKYGPLQNEHKKHPQQ